MIYISIIGPIGYETAAGIANEQRDMLTHRFSRRFMTGFSELRKELAELPPREPDSGLLYAEITEGGLLATLWKVLELWQERKQQMEEKQVFAGCRIYGDRIPVLQEITEILELFDENPLEVSSRGAFLILWDDEILLDPSFKNIVDIIQKSVIIGHITKDKKRVLILEEAERYLTPPVRQQKDLADRKSHRTG